MPDLSSPVVPAGRMRALEQPTLDAEGLIVRPWRADDASVVVAAYQDPGIQRWHVRSLDSAEAGEWIASWPQRWQAETGIDWAVANGSSVLGRIGIKSLDLFDGHGEVVYWVLPAGRGAGVAPRAVSAVADWAFGELGLHRLELAHSTQNPASCRVATKTGFALEATMRERGQHADGLHDMHLHARLAHGRPG